MTRIVLMVAAIVLLASAAAAAPVGSVVFFGGPGGRVNADRQTLRFNSDGKFKIMQFADTQYSHAWDECREITPEQLPCDGTNTTNMMRALIALEQPDLVVLTGDNIAGGANNVSYLDIISPMIDSNTPWAVVFGNHDEDSAVMSKAILSDIEHSYRPLSQFDDGPADIHGVGNYVLRILRSDGSNSSGFHLWMLDSGAYDLSGREIGGYDWIHADQIAWYVETLQTLEADIPALAFFHIPLQEYEYAWSQRGAGVACNGNSNEGVFDARVNSGFFSAAMDGGDVIGMFVGHDHVNDYICNLYDIRLVYGRGSGWTTYGQTGFMRGARVIEIEENTFAFQSHVILADGTIVEQDTYFGSS